MTDITIGGVSIKALKAQKESMQQEAVKFVSDAVDIGKAAFEQMLLAQTYEHGKEFAKQALEAFENAKLVADVTGVKYSLPYYEEGGNYSYQDVLSNQFDGDECEQLESRAQWLEELEFWGSNEDQLFTQLWDVLQTMESQCLDWYSSTC